jgi:hypothetical protein
MMLVIADTCPFIVEKLLVGSVEIQEKGSSDQAYDEIK